MFFAEGPRPAHTAAPTGSVGGSVAYQEWLQSKPVPGEAMVDTGLSSAADSQKLHWSLNSEEEAQFLQLIAKSVERDRELSRSAGGLEAEVKRINDVVGVVLRDAGLDPAAFGVSIPEQLSADGSSTPPVDNS
jgi:hypothetical protein